jgi:hypothetical protein
MEINIQRRQAINKRTHNLYILLTIKSWIFLTNCDHTDKFIILSKGHRIIKSYTQLYLDSYSNYKNKASNVVLGMKNYDDEIILQVISQPYLQNISTTY